MSGPFRRQGDALLVDVRLTPRSSRDALEGPTTLSDGRVAIAARVRAVPEDGRANAALVALVARAAGMPPSAVSLVGGATQRLKTLRLPGADAAVEARLLSTPTRRA